MIPRPFIVVPTSETTWSLSNMVYTKFRLHLICECGEHTKLAQRISAPASNIPHEPHPAMHDGCVVKKSTELFKKYGPFLVVTLELVKAGMGIASSVVPIVKSVNTVTSKGNDYSLKYLDTLIKTQGSVDVDNEVNVLREDLAKYLAGAKGLEGEDLRKLRLYLEANNSDNLLCSMYRMTTKDGHVKMGLPSPLPDQRSTEAHSEALQGGQVGTRGI